MANATEIIKFFDTPIGHFPDRIARWLFQNREYVRGLFEILAGHLVPRIDFSQLKLIERSFLADTLEELVADLVYRVPFRSESGTNELFIYILVEHQSTVDTKMAVRVLSYMISRFWLCNAGNGKRTTFPKVSNVIVRLFRLCFTPASRDGIPR
jgi:predicted transposase/invertase (TIGR01784 family)